MSAVVAILSPGALASVQDLGRHGYRRFGVPRAGTLAPDLLRIANRLVGNPDGSPAIEFFVGGLALAARDEPLQLGFAGNFAVEIVASDGAKRLLPSWRSVVLAPGEQARCGMIAGSRVGVVAVAGLAPPRLLGSASTYARAGLGQLLGAGDQLPATSVAPGTPCHWLPAPPAVAAPDTPIRLVLGPQDDHFSTAALVTLESVTYTVSREADRMGMRLDGPVLEHKPGMTEIASDGIVPGAIQVPGNGLPIVLLADGQTAGGYPKIATVISADLPRLAALPPGAPLRFSLIDLAGAALAARQAEAELLACLAAIEPLGPEGGIDLNALYTENLVSGMINAQAEEWKLLL